MCSTPHMRKWFLMLALPTLVLPTISRADDRADRESLKAAIEAVQVKIDLSIEKIKSIDEEISRIKTSIEEYRKLYKETKKEEYKKALNTALAKLDARLAQRADYVDSLTYYEEELAHLQEKLAQLDD